MMKNKSFADRIDLKQLETKVRFRFKMIAVFFVILLGVAAFIALYTLYLGSLDGYFWTQANFKENRGEETLRAEYTSLENGEKILVKSIEYENGVCVITISGAVKIGNTGTDISITINPSLSYSNINTYITFGDKYLVRKVPNFIFSEDFLKELAKTANTVSLIDEIFNRQLKENNFPEDPPYFYKILFSCILIGFLCTLPLIIFSLALIYSSFACIPADFAISTPLSALLKFIFSALLLTSIFKFSYNSIQYGFIIFYILGFGLFVHLSYSYWVPVRNFYLKYFAKLPDMRYRAALAAFGISFVFPQELLFADFAAIVQIAFPFAFIFSMWAIKNISLEIIHKSASCE